MTFNVINFNQCNQTSGILTQAHNSFPKELVQTSLTARVHFGQFSSTVKLNFANEKGCCLK